MLFSYVSSARQFLSRVSSTWEANEFRILFLYEFKLSVWSKYLCGFVLGKGSIDERIVVSKIRVWNFENIIKQDKLKVKVELDVSAQFSDEVKVHFWMDFITCDEKWMLYNSCTRSGHYSFLEQEDIVTVI